MAASSITVTVAPWVPHFVGLMVRCGCRDVARQAVVDFVWRHGMRVG